MLQLVYGTGARPPGEETAAFVQIVLWLENQAHAQKVRIESSGIRSQMVSLMARALQPEMFSELAIRDGIESLAYVLQKPVECGEAPDLFCLDLLRVTDLDRLAALSSPVRVLRVAAP